MKESPLTTFSRYMTGKVSRWVVIAVWVLATVVLTVAWPAVNQTEVNNAPNLSDNSPSVEAEKLIKKEFSNSSGVPALLTWHNESGLGNEDLKAIQQMAERLEKEPLEAQSSTPPLHKLPLPALQKMISKDGTTLVQPIFFKENVETDVLEKNIDTIKEEVKEQVSYNSFRTDIDEKDKLSTRVTGPVGIQIDATSLFEGADVSLLIATVLLVLILLLIIYRSPILAIIPLIGVSFAYGVLSPILGILADKGWITVDAQSISIMTVLLFGAGTDYCLFLISHYRDELRKVNDKRQALINAFKGASGAIAMSGFTVVISLLALIVAKYGAYHRFAIPFSLSILIMGIASLTLIPALLSVMGRGSFYPFIPRTPEMEEERAAKRGKPIRTQKEKSRFGNWAGNVVTTKPWTIIIACLVIFGALSIYSSQIKYTYDVLSSFPEDMPSREGFQVISDAYSPGELAPAQVVVDTEGKPTDVEKVLKKHTLVSAVSTPQSGQENKNLKVYDVTFNINPYSTEAMEAIPKLRDAAEKALSQSGISSAKSKVWISGQTATQYDTMTASDKDTSIIVPLIIIFISLLLLGYLRSIVAMLYLVGTVILSYSAALGLGWLIIHNVMGANAIQGAIPLYAFVFLVALGEDYNIFMISSIWQKKKHMPLKQAIKEGVSETSGVITSAGIILAATFAVLATLPIQVLVQFGIITALGVLLDTFIVRPFLVPAITTVFGKFAFWPSKVKVVQEKEH
ncbi:MMPL family transporter [Priestia megaterium]|uniref:MMPL family transporter n=1 Tax=Priestia megaterium TaxID=1404 RepID=UPI00272F68F3|nr:MMPL family transporter [Priestia megaterium]MDP1442112.1 MMPL family transporter [Priestia megaterium]MDP1471111.1 MMPL family transporter [Priestia megaterium]